MRKTLTLFAFACLGLGVQAQQLVRTDMANVGDSQNYRRADTTGVQDGPSGSGQAWNYSTLVPSPAAGINSYIAANTHPLGAQFPTANLAFNPFNGSYGFYISSPDSLYMIGEKSSANTIVSYTDGAAWFRYPQSFGVPNVDSVVGLYPDGIFSSVGRLGWTQTTFDGTGTLVTPFATYPSVKRVEYLAIHRDSSWTGAAFVDVFVRRYEWYASTQTTPVLIIHHQQVILNNGNPTTTKEIWWADPNATAVTPETGTAFDIYPNPSQGETKLSYTLDANTDVQIEVLNIVGGRVRLVVDENQSAGAHGYDLGGGLASGIYLVRMTTSQGSTTKKLVLN